MSYLLEKQKIVGMFGSASDKINEKYITEVENLGREIAKRNAILYFGAGSTGCMGAIARGAYDAKGKIFGVAPDFMENFEPIFDKCDKVFITKTMEDRKKTIKVVSDAFVICPGGIGTLDEFFEVLTDKYLKLHNKPIVLFNIDGYFSDIVSVINAYTEKKFISECVSNMFSVANTVEEACEMLGI